MRIALVATALLLVSACSGRPTVENGTSVPAAPTFAKPSAVVLPWGGSGSSSGVYLRVDAPKSTDRPVIGVDGKPDPAYRFVLLPITAGNKTTGTATVSVTGRVGQQEAGVYEGDNGVGEFLPGEGGPFERRVRVPVDAKELVVEVYANVDGKPTDGRLTFKGSLP